MFTGLVADHGHVAALGGGRGSRSTPRSPLELAAGDSVAVNGVCLTAVEHRRRPASAPT